VLIYRKGNDRLTVSQDVQASVEKVFAWCDEKGSNINPAKAVALWCSLDNRILRADVPAIKINDLPINRVDNFKYQGITFDRSLSFRGHVDNLVLKTRKGLIALKAMAATHIEQSMLYIWYHQLILSVIDYGLGCLTLSKSRLEKNERIQVEAMRIILGCTRNTPLVCMRYTLWIPTVFNRYKV
jgi:hypothetical protein